MYSVRALSMRAPIERYNPGAVTQGVGRLAPDSTTRGAVLLKGERLMIPVPVLTEKGIRFVDVRTKGCSRRSRNVPVAFDDILKDANSPHFYLQNWSWGAWIDFLRDVVLDYKALPLKETSGIVLGLSHSDSDGDPKIIPLPRKLGPYLKEIAEAIRQADLGERCELRKLPTRTIVELKPEGAFISPYGVPLRRVQGGTGKFYLDQKNRWKAVQ